MNTDYIENTAEQTDKPQSRSGKQLQSRTEQAASEQIQGRASHTEIQSLRATGQQSQRQRVKDK